MVNAFQISTESKSFVVFAETPQEKVEWMKDVSTWHLRVFIMPNIRFQINAAIDKLDKSYKTLKAKKKQRDSVGMLAPVWVPDNESKSCTICAVKFTVTNRRVSLSLSLFLIQLDANILLQHHCRQCGRVICGKCSTHKKDLPGQGRQRVCDDCYKKPVAVVNGTAPSKSTDEASSEELSDTSSFSSSLNSSQQQSDPLAISNAQNLAQEFAGRSVSPRNSHLSSSPGTQGGAHLQQPTEHVAPHTAVEPQVDYSSGQYTGNAVDQYVSTEPTQEQVQYETTAESYAQVQESAADVATQTGYNENATEYAEESTDQNQDYILVETQDPVCQVSPHSCSCSKPNIMNLGCG